MRIDEIFDGTRNEVEIVTILKCGKHSSIPSWNKLKKEYDPTLHKVNNPAIRKNKVKNGKEEEVARIYVGLQKLSVKRMTEFVFGVPVKRVYHYDESNEQAKQVVNAIEQIFMQNHINSENISRSNQYFASCEFCTQWFTSDSKNTLYGFPTSKKIRCRTFSPMNGYNLYPYFDDYGDMQAMSIEYSVVESGRTESKTYFETYTADRHIVFEIGGKNGYSVKTDEVNPLGKIPFVYVCREMPIWDKTTNIVDEIEMTLSRNSDVIAYNSAPILAVTGTLIGNEEEKGKTQRVYQLENGGSINYVSWSQATESIKFHIDTLQRMFWTQLQLPDISLDNIKGQLVSGEARKTLLTDAHLKVTDESGTLIEGFERETNIVKAFLKGLMPSWSAIIEGVVVEHVITPFIQNDERAEIDKWMAACGSKPIVSQLEAIKNCGISNNPSETLEQIQAEQAQSEQSRLNNLFEGAM